MALVFRWYLGLSSRWANAGEPTRKVDYQVWCGPAMGAFNEWTKGSFLEHRTAQRRVRRGPEPAVRRRRPAAPALASQPGRGLDPAWMHLEPLPPEELQRRLGGG